MIRKQTFVLFVQHSLQPKLSLMNCDSVSHALHVFNSAQNWVSISDGSRTVVRNKQERERDCWQNIGCYKWRQARRQAGDETASRVEMMT